MKLFGNDLETLEKTADKIKAVMADGARHHRPRRASTRSASRRSGSTSTAPAPRATASRPATSTRPIQAAIGGQAAGDLYEEGSDRHFPIIVRLAPEYRESLDAIRRITDRRRRIRTADGIVPIPLTDVATVSLVSGASFIYREQQERYVPIKFSVRGRDLGSAVLEAQQKVAEQVHDARRLSPGMGRRVRQSRGRAAAARDASCRSASALICVLLLRQFRLAQRHAAGRQRHSRWRSSAASSRCVLTGTPFSVSAAIGFVALFGIAAMDGIIVLSYFNRLIEQGVDRTAAHSAHLRRCRCGR